MRKIIFALFSLAMLAGCERYTVIAKVVNDNGGVIYMKDNSTGKIYCVYGNHVSEVPLEP